MVKDEEDQLILYDKETGRKLTMTTTLHAFRYTQETSCLADVMEKVGNHTKTEMVLP